MLDHATQSTIKNARNILVGKITSPMEQCHEITKSLVYKFISESDGIGESLGGAPFYFTGEAAECRWDRMLAMRHTADDIHRLYTEGLTHIGNRTDIPAAFLTIYRNAAPPHNVDPDTLRMFLEAVDKFPTDDTETIGDAFEHLLMDTGAQGKAGQFRTPRHIIDFIVGIIDPKKHETVLDPACGTAGFLASAYQHINKANDKALTSIEYEQIAQNLVGYDISPDMVKLATIHMFLQHNQSPPIEAYDTLTNDEHWNDRYDVILTNPPFMTPRGAIKPNQRFYSKANKAEVLFVDYINSHLNENGRAGIVVPEGIVFNGNRAYKDLRRLILDESLVAVISLPSGVFNPYSGVKTSILILDKAVARSTDSIAFFKVEQDGYDLGAQRKQITADDLPTVSAEVSEYLRRLRTGESMDGYVPTKGHIVAKCKIAEDGDYNLSSERYLIATSKPSTFPMVPLGEIAELIRGITFRKSDQLTSETSESLRVATTKAAQENGIVEEDLYHIPADLLKDSKKILRKGDILISTANSLNLLGRTTHVPQMEHPTSFGAFMSLIRCNEKVLDTYLLHCMRTERVKELVRANANTTTNISNLNFGVLAKIEIPLPSLEVQRELVAEIESYQQVIKGARAVVDNWRPQIVVDPEWPIVKVGEAFTRSTETMIPSESEGPITYVGLENISQHTGHLVGNTITEDPATIKSLKNEFECGNILYGKLRPNLNKVWLSDRSGICSTDIYVIRPKQDDIVPELYAHIFRSRQFNDAVMTQVEGAQLPRVGWNAIARLEIPLPPLEVQQTIADEIASEQAAIDHAKALASKMEQRTQETIARIWATK